ncbi:class I adenylate-forming enzyme family protein [Allokutzneria albata]|uniref:Long-chain acyl-CoA synthetase n=1 Tax=Allokutzneria albata TaxID=211114 RepID=A0A1G9RJ51_ALLAB|nr:class I adenylate-forming enzyme family protein [Allokutzneria albata]SDM23090.1 long-chain acyl-CoA synthetase [Allokutzneria albata]
MILPDVFSACLRAHPDRLAVSDGATGLTYSDLDVRSAALGDRLRAHGRSRIGIHATNSPDYVMWYIASLRAGFVPFLIDAALGAHELARIVYDCSLDLLVHEGPGAEVLGGGKLALSELVTDTDPVYELLPDTEVCRFTSGSTGKPNCVEFSGRAVANAATNWASGTGLSSEDRTLCLAGLSNGLAFNTSLLATFLAGASLHFGRGLPTASAVLRRIEETGATRLVGFPALYDSLVRRGIRRLDVRMAISSGAPLSARTREALPGISDYYGIAETGPLTFTADPAPGGLGPPLPGVRLRVDDGVLHVRSESMASRYLNAPGLFESRLDAEGFYRTGDEGYLRDGELVLTGRSARTINIGGRKVDPIEVSDVLLAAEGVRGAVVFEEADAHGEPMITAVVAASSTVDLREHCRARLPGYKVPARVHVVPEIPANSIGKPAMEAVRALVAHHSGAVNEPA